MKGQAALAGVSIRWGTATDVGLTRSVNEDSSLAEAPVFLVADGMGGHAAGDVASQLLVERFRPLADGVLRPSEPVVEAIQDANAEIFEAGAPGDAVLSMGTTAVGIALVENGPSVSWLVFNVGDSRIYRYFEGSLERLSTDHSFVQELVDAGEISPREARTHPRRNVITRALGVESTVLTDIWLRTPTTGERFVLCSDGLSSEVDDEHIARLAGMSGEPYGIAKQLVASALDAGGRDNVTVLILDVVDADDADDASGDYVTAPREEVPALQVAVEPGEELSAAVEEDLAAPSDLIDAMPSWVDAPDSEATVPDALGDHVEADTETDMIDADEVPSPPRRQNGLPT